MCTAEYSYCTKCSKIKHKSRHNPCLITSLSLSLKINIYEWYIDQSTIRTRVLYISYLTEVPCTRFLYKIFFFLSWPHNFLTMAGQLYWSRYTLSSQSFPLPGNDVRLAAVFSSCLTNFICICFELHITENGRIIV